MIWDLPILFQRFKLEIKQIVQEVFSVDVFDVEFINARKVVGGNTDGLSLSYK